MWTLTVIISQVLRVVGCLLLQLFLLVPRLHRWTLSYDINQTSETQLFSSGNTSLVCIRLPSNIATASYLCLLCHFLMLKCLRDVTGQFFHHTSTLISMSQIFSFHHGSDKSTQKAVQQPNFADFSRFREEVSVHVLVESPSWNKQSGLLAWFYLVWQAGFRGGLIAFLGQAGLSGSDWNPCSPSS